MIQLLAWASFLVFIFLAVVAAMPGWIQQMEEEGHLERRKPKHEHQPPAAPNNVYDIKQRRK